MIRPAQLKLLERASAEVGPRAGDFPDVLRRYGGSDAIEALTAQGFARMMDHYTVNGFRCRQRPVLSAGTLKLIAYVVDAMDFTPHVYAADLRGYAGVSDARDLTGRGLIELLTRWEGRGLKVAVFHDRRRQITSAQLRLLQVARRRIELTDSSWYGMLQDWGGVITSADLDRRGFDLCMAFLEASGFERSPAPAIGPAFGSRPGFASPEQVDLIRTLWREWTRPTAESDAAIEAGLNAWLERFHRVSSLRFLTTTGAGKAITALKAMKARSPNKFHDDKEPIERPSLAR